MWAASSLPAIGLGLSPVIFYRGGVFARYVVEGCAQVKSVQGGRAIRFFHAGFYSLGRDAG